VFVWIICGMLVALAAFLVRDLRLLKQENERLHKRVDALRLKMYRARRLADKGRAGLLAANEVFPWESTSPLHRARRAPARLHDLLRTPGTASLAAAESDGILKRAPDGSWYFCGRTDHQGLAE
jgi:hypothetical protein